MGKKWQKENNTVVYKQEIIIIIITRQAPAASPTVKICLYYLSLNIPITPLGVNKLLILNQFVIYCKLLYGL